MVTKVRSSVLDREIITALAADSAPDIINDFMLVYDASADAFKKVALHKTFPQGTRMSFQQNNAPTGWTKDTATALNDSAMRIVTGNVTSGGSLAFSTWSAQTTAGGTTLSTSQMPSHSHATSFYLAGAYGGSSSPGTTNTGVSATTIGTTSVGGSAVHTHSLTQNLKYYDFIIATKD